MSGYGPGVDEYGLTGGDRRPRRRERPRALLPALLFITTVLTTVIAGALYQGADIFNRPWELSMGVPFSASLLFVLGTHELGHYLASRAHGVSTTLPMFIPGVPVPPFIGTFGAVIRIKSPITTRRALVDIGAAGPLAGFAAMLVILVPGLGLSSPAPASGAPFGLGSSLLLKLLTHLMVGPLPAGYDLVLHPIAFAAWIGMFVTAMNLLPVGQLDGGHIVYALIGPRHRLFSLVMIAVLLTLGAFAWYGWFLWAAVIAAIALWHPPVEDPRVPLDLRRKATSAAAMLVFVLTFMPTPFYIVQ